MNRTQINEIKKISNEVNKIAGPTIDISKSIYTTVEPLKNAIMNIGEFIATLRNSFKTLLSEICTEEALNQIIKIAYEIEQLPENMRVVMLKLASEGWFYGTDINIGVIKEMKTLLNDDEIDLVENFLMDYFKEHLDYVENIVIEKSPHRKLILQDAFYAHREGRYNLSIPIFLSQAEGICYEITKKSCFNKKQGIPHTAEYINEKDLAEDEIESVMSILLTQPFPINESINTNIEKFDGVNRHLILHGKSITYGTEKNSLKSISFLNYIVELFSLLEN